MKPTNDKCTGIFPLFWFTQILNSTARIIASDSRIQDDLGQWIQCHWRLRDESEPIPGPDWSLGSIYWAPIASELPSEVTSDPSIQGKYCLEVQPGSGYYSSWNQQKRKKPRSWAVPVTENLEMIVKKFQKSFKRIWCDTSIWFLVMKSSQEPPVQNSRKSIFEINGLCFPTAFLINEDFFLELNFGSYSRTHRPSTLIFWISRCLTKDDCNFFFFFGYNLEPVW